MQIGMKDYKIGTRVRIKNIVDPGPKNQDGDLNGKVGRLVPKFAEIPYGVVGIYVAPERIGGQKISVKANLNAGEFEEI